MSHSSAAIDWPSTRNRIYQRFLGKLPQHKREPLDLVELIHNRFPEWSWVEIAGWMDGSKIPMESQQSTLMHWEQAFEEPRPFAMPIELGSGDRQLARFDREE